MQVSKFGLTGAIAVLGSCVAVGAMAQPPAAGQPPAGRQGGRGGAFGRGRFGQPLTLANAPLDVLSTELKLTDDQKTAIAATRAKVQTDMAALRPTDGTQPNFQELMPKIQEINQKAVKDIEAVLKDDQKSDAPALLKNLQVLQSLRIPLQTYSDLKLTAEARTKLSEVAASVAKDMAAKAQELQTARDAGDQAKMQELMVAMRGNRQPNEKALASLTAEQRDLIAKYIKDHPQQGGRRPGGPAPGAGAAPNT